MVDSERLVDSYQNTPTGPRESDEFIMVVSPGNFYLNIYSEWSTIPEQYYDGNDSFPMWFPIITLWAIIFFSPEK